MPDARVTESEFTNRAPDTPQSRSGARERLLERLPLTERRLTLNGLRTSVLEGGEGPPVLLLHGPGEYAAKWLRIIPDLVSTHRVIAPDLPGHGASEAFEGMPTVDAMVGWMEDLIDCTCAVALTLVGQIVGGAIAAHYASARGERLERLVLVDTLGLRPFQPAPGFGRALSEFYADPNEETHDLLWAQCAFDLSRLRERLGSQWHWIKTYNLELARTPGVAAAQGRLMEQFGIPAIPPSVLARITVPTTLVWGRHDLATPLAAAEAASARYGWPLHVIDGAADDPPIEQPAAFLQVLRTIVDGPIRSGRRQP